MKLVDRYIHDVMANVFAAPDERNRFAADLRAHFAAAEAAGEPPARAIESMGAAADVAAAFNAERQMVYGGFWRRLVAFIGDVGLLMVCSIPVATLAVLAGTGLPERIERPDDLMTLATILLFGCAGFGLVVFYFPLLEWRFGKTLGKHLMGLRAVRENGAPLGLGRAFVRRLSLFFDLLVIDALFIPFTDKKQRALDIVAKTVVAREPGREVGWTGYAACLLLPVMGVLALALIAALAPS